MDKGQRAAGWAGQSGQVMSGHGGHGAGYTMCELRYGITAQLFSVNGRRSVRWLRLVVDNGCLCLDDMKPALEGGATGLEMGEALLRSLSILHAAMVLSLSQPTVTAICRDARRIPAVPVR